MSVLGGCESKEKFRQLLALNPIQVSAIIIFFIVQWLESLHFQAPLSLLQTKLP